MTPRNVNINILQSSNLNLRIWKYWVLVMVFSILLKCLKVLGILYNFVGVVVLGIQYFETSIGSYPANIVGCLFDGGDCCMKDSITDYCSECICKDPSALYVTGKYVCVNQNILIFPLNHSNFRFYYYTSNVCWIDIRWVSGLQLKSTCLEVEGKLLVAFTFYSYKCHVKQAEIQDFRI